MVEFSVHDKIIYPLKGLGDIIDIVSEKVLDEEVKMYKIQLKDMTVFIPLKDMKTLGIRKPLKPKEINKILDFIEQPDTGFNPDWIKRLEDNKVKSSSGDIYDLVDVIKTSTIVATSDPLNRWEKSLLTECKKYLSEEIAYSHETTKEEGKRKLDASLRKLAKNYENLKTTLESAKKLYYKGKYFPCISEFTKIIEIDKNNIEAITLLADSYCKKEMMEKTEEFFELAKKINPNHYLFNLKYGYYIFNLGKKEEALQYFRKCSENIEDNKEKKELYEFLKSNYEE